VLCEYRPIDAGLLSDIMRQAYVKSGTGWCSAEVSHAALRGSRRFSQDNVRWSISNCSSERVMNTKGMNGRMHARNWPQGQNKGCSSHDNSTQALIVFWGFR
jgi:hypothetical protein